MPSIGKSTLTPTDAVKKLTKAIRPPSKPTVKPSESGIIVLSAPTPAAPEPSPAVDLPASRMEVSAVSSAEALAKEEALAKAETPASAINLPSTATPLHQILGLPAEIEVRIPEMVERLKVHRQLEGVFVSTEDGLPLAGSMPEGMDANAWGGIGPKFFRKLDQETQIVSLGKPRRCTFVLQNRCVTICHEPGIYLILSHRLENLSPEFEEHTSILALEIAPRCEKQDASP